MKVIENGTLRIVESFNGFYLYGQVWDRGELKHYCIAHMGDGVDSIESSPDYNPNDGYDLPEAYGFELVGMIQ